MATGRVLVVGGGIAGFALLRACSTAGVEAHLVDRRPAPPDEGLGLNLPGNGVRALMALGVRGLDEGGEPVRRREYRTGTGRLVFAVDEAAFWADGPGSLCVRRKDVLRLLRAGVQGDQVRWGAPVATVSSEAETVRVGLADGRTEWYDLVVGADGVDSTVRAATLGGATQSSVLSAASWRFMTANPGVDCWTAWTSAQGTVLLIPVTGGQVYGYASATRGGRVDTDPAWLTTTFGDFPEPARSAIRAAAAEPTSLYHSPVAEVRIPRWWTGRVILVGDAAHATAPVWAQGAALAAEDALVLAELLAASHDWSGVGAEFERRRRPRVDHVQLMTDRLSKAAGLPIWLRDLVLPVLGPRTYRETYTPLREPVGATRAAG